MKPLWTPSRERAQASELARFMRLAGKTSYEELHRWSIERSADFWELVWRFAEVRGEMGDRRLIDADRMPGARWFPTRASTMRRTCCASATQPRRSRSGARTASVASRASFTTSCRGSLKLSPTPA